MKLLPKFIILVAVIILSGCAGMGAHKVLELQDNQKILVISSMGSEFELLNVGTTIFSNESKSISVSKWNLNDYIETEVTKLSSNSRFEFIRQQNVLPEKDPKLMTSMWSLKVDLKDLNDHIFSFAKGKGYDLVLFVNSFENEDSIFGTNQYYSGYGLYKRSSWGSPKAVLFARVALTLYDVNTQKKITGLWETVSKPSANYSQYKKLSEIKNKQIFNEKVEIESMIKGSILKQLKQLNITN